MDRVKGLKTSLAVIANEPVLAQNQAAEFQSEAGLSDGVVVGRECVCPALVRERIALQIQSYLEPHDGKWPSDQNGHVRVRASAERIDQPQRLVDHPHEVVEACVGLFLGRDKPSNDTP